MPTNLWSYFKFKSHCSLLEILIPEHSSSFSLFLWEPVLHLQPLIKKATSFIKKQVPHHTCKSQRVIQHSSGISSM